MKIKKDSRKIRLLGKGDGWKEAPDNDEFELWGLNGLLFSNKKLDKIFMMDIIDEMPSVVSGLWEVDEVVRKLNELRLEIISPVVYDEIPTSKSFPLKAAVREFGIPYFNNTIAYMICYALLKGVEEIQIWGINQASGTEYFYEKGCVEYWLGIAIGMGVRVSVHGKRSELLTNKQRYGGNRLYGYNTSYEGIIRNREKFGEAKVRKLTQPQTSNQTIMLGGQKTKSGLRTTDLMGVRKLWTSYANHPEGGWVIGQNDAFNLARLVADEKPKNILDLGTGIGASAAIMKYIYPKANIYSVEQNEKCTKFAKKLTKVYLGLPINFRQSEPELFKVSSIPQFELSGYKKLPKLTKNKKWDLVVIDGPGEFMVGEHLIKPISADIFRILNDIKENGLVYIDGRVNIVNLISRFLRAFLTLEKHTSEFTVFKRTKKIYKEELVVDSLKEQLIKNNYFN